MVIRENTQSRTKAVLKVLDDRNTDFYINPERHGFFLYVAFSRKHVNLVYAVNILKSLGNKGVHLKIF